MNREEIAWAAGFFDGEGCTTTTSRGYPMLTVGQNFREPLVHALLWPYLCSPKQAQANAVWDQFDAKRAANPKIGQGSGRHKARIVTGRQS